MLIPNGPEELTVEAMAKMMGRRVDAVTGVTPVGTGQMASCYRVELVGDGLPPSVIAKIAAPGATDMAANGYRAEVLFYREIAPRIVADIPDCYYAAADTAAPRFVLLLEDLAPAVQGNQLGGLTIGQAQSAVANLAAIHAALWQDPALDGWFPPATKTDGPDMLVEFMRGGSKMFIERYAERLPADHVAVIETFCERLPGYRNNRSSARTIIHGDYRPDNLLFAPDDESRCVAVDFQTAGAGAAGHDLAFCIAMSLTPAMRAAHERELVAHYANVLRARGVNATDGELWDDYRFGHGHDMVVTVLGAITAQRTDRGDDMFMVMTERTCEAMKACDTLAMYA